MLNFAISMPLRHIIVRKLNGCQTDTLVFTAMPGCAFIYLFVENILLLW